jgi:hypothetical protein
MSSSVTALTSSLRRHVLFVALCLVGCLVGSPAAAGAAVFTVTTTADGAESGGAGSGDCVSSAAGGGCTLRAAVQEADAVSGSTVVVPAGDYRLSIPSSALESPAGSVLGVDPASGDLDLTDRMTIKGAGARQTIIDGEGLDRVFAVDPGATVFLSDMTITGGDATLGGKSQGIALGGAILNGGAITLDRVVLTGNVADGGGGMFSIPGTTPLVENSLIADNRAYSGGGLRLDAGGTIINTTITGNVVLPPQPAAVALGERPVATVFGLAVGESNGWGGGIDNRGLGDVVIVNSTITGNHAIKGGGGVDAGQGYAPISPALALGKMTLQNTIIADNTIASGPQNCHVEDQVIQSLGHNLATDRSCFLTAAGDLPNSDPRLRPLADNGGPTDTEALLPGSPAIDTGDAAACPATDQRGVARPSRQCDIGAFQYRGAAPAASQRCTVTVRLPARVRSRARSFDVLFGHRVIAHRRAPRSTIRVRVPGGHAKRPVVLRVHLRNGRTMRLTDRARVACV